MEYDSAVGDCLKANFAKYSNTIGMIKKLLILQNLLLCFAHSGRSCKYYARISILLNIDNNDMN